MPQDTHRPGWVPSEECAPAWWQDENSQAFQGEEPIQRPFVQPHAYTHFLEYPLYQQGSTTGHAPSELSGFVADLPDDRQSVPLMNASAPAFRHPLPPASFGGSSCDLGTFPRHAPGPPTYFTPSPLAPPPPPSPAMSTASMGAYHIPPSPSDATRGLDQTIGPRRDVGSEAQAAASHQRRHPENVGESKFRCDMCGRTFTRKHNYNDHLLRHANQKQFACDTPSCASRFNTNGDLKSHIKKMHRTAETP
ncbi:uncharacterized protein SCHCODRAFT_02620554 [Schizophyllum commune H4-8]|nr:uncharacterized protein SCHCODRAFT_02620554 [Schizophyllum commune H4-8]KAI5895902.1 hypothetical protein SCHCODRAFT_02620554 [Schizophyllum commune H4-8]